MRRTLTAAALVLILASSACEPTSGRYIDETFTGVSVARDLVYGEAPDEQGATEVLRLDLYQPAGDTLARRPAIVWVHGGGFTGGTRAAMATEAAAFAKRGYVTVSISYRLREGEYFDDLADPLFQRAVADAQHDAQAAVRWLRANADRYRVDTGRVAIGGSSAGAITALEVGYGSHDPGTSGNPGFSSAVGGVVSQAGAAAEPNAIGAGDAPATMFHGTADARVPYALAQDTCDTARERGLVCELHAFQGVGHGVRGGGRDAEITRQTAGFLYRMLGLTQ